MTLKDRIALIFETLSRDLDGDAHAAIEQARASLYHARKSLDIETLQLRARLHVFDPRSDSFVPEAETQLVSAYCSSAYVIVTMPAGNLYKLPRWENYDTKHRKWRHWPKDGRKSKRSAFFVDFEVVQ